MDAIAPGKVQLADVSPRDGLQNESAPVSTATKIELVDRLFAAGMPRVEVTSFVSPKAVPQMADAEEVMRGITRRPGAEVMVLVPNARGLERALAFDVDVVNVTIAATEAFNRRNVNMSIADSLANLAVIARMAEEARITLSVVISTAFHCPFEGPVPMEAVDRVAEACVDLGIAEVGLGDTIGSATPDHVAALVRRWLARWPHLSVGMHLHDTRGMGVANAAAAVEAGATRLDASTGRVGGCPFAPGASGNAASEEVLYMLQARGLCTEIDLDAVIATGRWLLEALGRPPTGLVRAGLPRAVPVS